jgi:hypothetical protein
MIGAEPTPEHRAHHPQLCSWLDANAIADRSNIVVFTTARLRIKNVDTSVSGNDPEESVSQP